MLENVDWGATATFVACCGFIVFGMIRFKKEIEGG